jgi:hypothetical protein
MFLDKILTFRTEKKQDCHEKIVKLLYGSMKSAFQYVVSLKHEDKPNYELIKLWMAFDEEDEKKVFDTQIEVNN